MHALRGGDSAKLVYVPLKHRAADGLVLAVAYLRDKGVDLLQLRIRVNGRGGDERGRVVAVGRGGKAYAADVYLQRALKSVTTPRIFTTLPMSGAPTGPV